MIRTNVKSGLDRGGQFSAGRNTERDPLGAVADYNSGTPAWYALSCFKVMCVAISFIAGWLRMRSDCLWTAAILHGSHNLYTQSILPPVTAGTGVTRYLIGEFGIGLAITTVIGAVPVWRRQDELAQPAQRSHRT